MDAVTRYRPRTSVLRALIQSRGYAPLARQLGTSAGYLHDLAYGRRQGSRDTLEAIAAAFDLTLQDIADPITREPAA